MIEQNREVVRDLYNAVTVGDTETADSLLADDCAFYEPDGHPAAGAWKGKASVAAGIAEVFGALRFSGVTVHEIVADGPSRVIGLISAHGTDSRGESYSMPMAECFLIENGKVAEIRPYYWDLVRLRRLCEARESEGRSN